MPSSADRKKKYIQKLKDNGLYDIYKEKKARQERERRKRLKDGLEKVSKATRTKILNAKRRSCRDRVRKWREKWKKQNANPDQASSSRVFGQSGYKTERGLARAVAKVEKTLPSSPTLRKAVVSHLFHLFFDEDEKPQIIHDLQLNENSKQAINTASIDGVEHFGESGDIKDLAFSIKTE